MVTMLLPTVGSAGDVHLVLALAGRVDFADGLRRTCMPLEAATVACEPVEMPQ